MRSTMIQNVLNVVRPTLKGIPRLVPRLPTVPDTHALHGSRLISTKGIRNLGKTPTVPEGYQSRVKDFGVHQPLNPYSDLKVYCLPTIGANLVFHPRILTSVTKGERLYKTAVFISRRYRYKIGDFISKIFGSWEESRSTFKRNMLKRVMGLINRDCAHEYFFSGITPRAKHIEIIYPQGLIRGGQSKVKIQLQEMIDKNAKAAGGNLNSHFIVVLLTGVTVLFVAPSAFPILYPAVVYVAARAIMKKKADRGSSILKGLMNSGRVKYTESTAMRDYLVKTSNELSSEIKKETGYPYQIKPDSDINPKVINKVENDLRLYELSRTYNRSRRFIIYR